MCLHHTPDKGDTDEVAVQLATFWGAFSLDKYEGGITQVTSDHKADE
jgi:hypothetical protein